jgi:hypothetical protein
MTNKNQEPKRGRPEKIDYFLKDTNFRKQVENAEIIFCIDEATGRKTIEFGRGFLTQVAAMPNGISRDVGILVVPLRAETLEYEALIALIQEVKGYYDNNEAGRAEIDLMKLSAVPTKNDRTTH